MLSLSDDLGNFTGAARLGTEPSHSRSTVGHDDLLAIFDRAVLFALHAVALNVGHVAQPVPLGPDIERFCSHSYKNGNYWAKRRGSEAQNERNWRIENRHRGKNA